MAEQLTITAIEQRLCTEIQVLLALTPGAVLPDTSLRSLGMDSLRFVSLLIAIEKVFGLSLMKAGLKREAIQSVRTLAAAIHAGQHP
jgi:acyl carrier protein